MTTHYIIMVIFHSYVKLPESKSSLNVGWIPSRNPRVWFYNILEEPRNQTQIILIWSPQTHILNSNLCESNSDSQITSSFQKWIYIYIPMSISQTKPCQGPGIVWADVFGTGPSECPLATGHRLQGGRFEPAKRGKTTGWALTTWFGGWFGTWL